MWRKDSIARKKFYEDYSRVPYSLKSYSHPNPFSRLFSNERRNLILKLMKKSCFKTCRFLDVGCADGYYVSMAEMMGVTTSVGIDIANNSLKRARDLARLKNSKDSHFICADAQNLPFRDCVFDFCLLSEVLEHCPEPWKALKEFWRVSRDICILSIPTGESFPWVKIIKKIGRFTGVKKEEAGHLHNIDFQEAMKKVGELDPEILDVNGAVACYWTLLAYPIGQAKIFSRILVRLLPKLIPFDVFICHRFPVVSATLFFWFRRFQ